MKCPRCGNDWDASKGPCTNCGFAIRMTGQSGPTSRNIPSQRRTGQSSILSSGNQPLSGLPTINNQPPSTGIPSSQRVRGSDPMRPVTPTPTPIPPRGSAIAPNTPANPSLYRPPFEKNALQRVPTNRGTDLSQPLPDTDPSSFDMLSPKTPFQHSQITPQGNPSTNVLQPNEGRSQFPFSANMQTPTPSFGGNILRKDSQQAPLQRQQKVSGPLSQTPPDQFVNLVQQQKISGSPSGGLPSVNQGTFLQQQQRTPASTSGAVSGTSQLSNLFQQQKASGSTQQTVFNSPRPTSTPPGVRSLLPGVLLRGGRYRLQELRERQQWSDNVFEAIWTAQDAHRGGSHVMVCEVVLPDNRSAQTLSYLRAATMTLVSLGRHPRIPALWDAFSDQGRSFFVFEPIDGESLLARIGRMGRALPEQEVIECCLQMTEVLELLAQQSPPLVHGLIRPEHIILCRNDSQYVLTNFSIVLAGGATQFVSETESTDLSPYTAPEVSRGIIDTRTDLFSLLATAYHGVTGTGPTELNGSIPSAQQFNPAVSPQFDAILLKGLRPIANQRYQRPAELRQDLLAIRSVSGSIVSDNDNGAVSSNPTYASSRAPVTTRVSPLSRTSATNSIRVTDSTSQASRNIQGPEQTAQRLPDSVAEALPMMLAPTEGILEERTTLLPPPEELEPMKESNDTMNAVYWLSGILVCLILIVIFSHILG